MSLGGARGLPEFREKPRLYVCSSSKNMGELIDKSKRLSNNKEFVLLLDYDDTIIKKILPAYVNSRLRMSEGILRSNSAQMETLLLACGTMNIRKALKECGAKDTRKFLLFTTSDALMKRFAEKNMVRIARRVDLQMDEKIAGEVALTELSGE